MKPSNFKPTKHKLALEKIAALGYPVAKIFLKEHNVPTLVPLVLAMLMSAIRRTRSTNAINDTGSDEYVALIEGKRASQTDSISHSARYFTF